MKIIIALLLLLAVDVYAETNYTDYEFVGYVSKIDEDGELYKYEEVKINRFYSYQETDVYYDILKEELDDGVYVDYNDKVLDNESWSTGRINDTSEHVYFAKNYIVDFSLNTIQFANFNMAGESNTVNEIEVYYNDQLVKYNSDYEWLNDGDYSNGFNLAKVTFSLTFDEILESDNIKVIIYYSVYAPFKNFFKFKVVNFLGQCPTFNISLDGELGVNKKTTIIFMSRSQYEKKLVEYGLMTESNVESSINYSLYRTPTYKYKHYRQIKVYYIDSEETYLDGYMYDEEESVTKYKKYKREIIEEPPEVVETVKEVESVEPVPTPIISKVTKKPIAFTSEVKEEPMIEEINDEEIVDNYDSYSQDNAVIEEEPKRLNRLLLIPIILISIIILTLIIRFFIRLFTDNYD